VSPNEGGFAIGNGLIINYDSHTKWSVLANGTKFNLDDVRDFYRVWLLLEHPFPQAKSSLDALAKDAGANEGFPFWKVIAAALDAKSAQWTDLAVGWLPFLDVTEIALLKDSLVAARDSKWASQHSRQIARKFAK
jgi:hypothetical protein